MLRVLQNKSIPSRDESEGSFVTCDTLIGEVLEDLFQSRLANTVLLDAEWVLLLLKLSKEPSNGLVFFWHTHLEEFSTVLKDLNISEITRQETQDAKAVGLGSQELK